MRIDGKNCKIAIVRRKHWSIKRVSKIAGKWDPSHHTAVFTQLHGTILNLWSKISIKII